MEESYPRIPDGCVGHHHPDDHRHVWHSEDCPIHPHAPVALLVIDFGEDRGEYVR
jgi:hypothetical protein